MFQDDDGDDDHDDEGFIYSIYIPINSSSYVTPLFGKHIIAKYAVL